ncbi:MAG: S41 family peptidase [Lachnospiraceae bacterium]
MGKRKKEKNLILFLLIICMLLLTIVLFLTGRYIKLEAKLGIIEKIVDMNYLEEIDEKQLEEYIYKGYVAGLEDPYSAYYTKEEYDELNEQNTGAYVGIGVTIAKDNDTSEIVFKEAYEGSPAKEAGIEEGDILLKINGESVEGMELDSIISKIKGKENVTIHLTVLRDKKEINIDVTTREVEITTVESKMLENKIGYIKLSQFIEVSSEQFKEAYEKLKEDGATSLIVDLRDNPGGLLSEVVDIADYFLPKKKMIVYTKNKNGKGDEYKSSDEQLIDMPVAVLINGESASASEILTGVIKDYKIGTIVGENTFGKGIVQKFYPLVDGSAVKLTVEKYYTPNGNDIHKKGIAPDIEVKQNEEDKEDKQLEKAIQILKK